MRWQAAMASDSPLAAFALVPLVLTEQACNVNVIRHVILCNGSCNQLCNRDVIDHVMRHVITRQSCNMHVI